MLERRKILAKKQALIFAHHISTDEVFGALSDSIIY